MYYIILRHSRVGVQLCMCWKHILCTLTYTIGGFSPPFLFGGFLVGPLLQILHDKFRRLLQWLIATLTSTNYPIGTLWYHLSKIERTKTTCEVLLFTSLCALSTLCLPSHLFISLNLSPPPWFIFRDIWNQNTHTVHFQPPTPFVRHLSYAVSFDHSPPPFK